MTRSFEEAIRGVSGGAVIDVEVSPGAKSAEVPSGYNPWHLSDIYYNMYTDK